MKRIITSVALLVMFVLMSFVGFAQHKIGVRFGYNLSGIYEFMEFKTDDGKAWKSGINFGVVSDLQLTEKILFRPGLYYSMKGFKGDDYNAKFNYNYLEAPLLAVFQQPLGESLKLEIQVGPYFGLGICGKSEIFDMPKFNTFGSESDDARFDWGLNIGCGVNFSKIYLGVSFEDGFVSYGRQSKQHCLMANVGYNF